MMTDKFEEQDDYEERNGLDERNDYQEPQDFRELASPLLHDGGLCAFAVIARYQK